MAGVELAEPLNTESSGKADKKLAIQPDSPSLLSSSEPGSPRRPAPLCCGKKRKVVLRYVALVMVLLIIATLPVCAWVLYKRVHQEKHVVAWFVAGVFALLTIPISLFGMILHLNHYTKPEIQRYILRIQWMPPIYGLTSWFALLQKERAIYLETVRECYEAYVIYSFTFFLIAVIHDFEKQGKLRQVTTSSSGSVDKVITVEPSSGDKKKATHGGDKHGKKEGEEEEEHEDGEKHMHHMIPCCCLKPWSMSDETTNPDGTKTESTFLRRCKWGVLLYCIVRLLTTFVAFVTEHKGKFGDGEFKFDHAWIYCILANNFAQLWAMYCLVLFYHTYTKELKPIRPFGKFVCIKAVVFFSFWQSVGIAGLVKVHYIKEDTAWTSYNVHYVADGLQNFLICIEMFLAAWAHLYAFRHEDYKTGNDPVLGICTKMRTIFDVRDVGQDVKAILPRIALDKDDKDQD